MAIKKRKKIAIIESDMLEPYYVEIIPLNMMVKKRGSTKVIGYYSHMKYCLKRIFYLQFEDTLFTVKNMKLKEYADFFVNEQKGFVEKIGKAHWKRRDK